MSIHFESLREAWTDAVMQWVVPESLPNHPRIYATLDEDDAIAEIHTNNNKGFNILSVAGAVANEDPLGDDVLPGTVRLSAPYPNPFSHAAQIPYEIGTPGEVVIDVYDVLGRRIIRLEEGMRAAGKHSSVWEAAGQANGMYILRLQTEQGSHTRKVMLLR